MLTFEKLDRDHVASLKCSVCARFEDKLQSSRNYNPEFVIGTKNLRVSAFKDHVATDMHQHSMILFSKSRSSDVTQYMPIVKALCTAWCSGSTAGYLTEALDFLVGLAS